MNYMKDRLHQGNAAAAKNVSNWSGTCYVMPLLGAFVADAYAGRYWTISSFMIIYIMVVESSDRSRRNIDGFELKERAN